MAEIKVSQLPEASGINDADLLMIVQGGVNKKITKENCQFASGDEISVGTTEPSEEEKLWINPEDVPSGSGSYISNVYSDAQDKAYSCHYINNANTYSTTEIDTGKKWIDGKPIYRKVYTNDNYSQNASETKDISFSLPNLDTIIWTYGTIKTNNNSPLISPWANANGMEYSSNYGAITSTGFKINTGNANPVSNAKIYIIFEYTKTTD